MPESQQLTLKDRLDKFLIFNFFGVLVGFFFFFLGVISSAFGFTAFYSIFQKLWFPLYIPVISIFFTAVLTEAIWNRLIK
tara:strand:- start:3253 stop:3492 length:240 start_codon:yes stop_codon:yes gene_type:complete